MTKEIATIKISEIFSSIQGESIYQGIPVTFIRTFSCNRKCKFCDSRYARVGPHKVMNTDEIMDEVIKLRSEKVVLSGGEPFLWYREIKKMIANYPQYKYMAETNGTLLYKDMFDVFDYICFSPKSISDMQHLHWFLVNLTDLDDTKFDIKIVTDLKEIGMDMLEYATMLQPLRADTKTKSRIIAVRVWEYCSKHHIPMSFGMHYWLFGKRRGV